MDRYSRQLLYKNIDEASQKKLKEATVCIIGVGALGTVCAELLARAGVGNLVLVDRDYVELSNLQRQALFTEEDIGRAKAVAARDAIKRIDPSITVEEKVMDVTSRNITLLEKPDIILGTTDNMQSRFMINEYARKYRIPWIYGAAVQDKGTVFNIVEDGPCLRCFIKGSGNDSCDTLGILNAASFMTGTLIANEAIKVLVGKAYEKKMIRFNVWSNEYTKIQVKKNPDCPVCNGRYETLENKGGLKLVRMCGTGAYQISGKRPDNVKMLKENPRQIEGILHLENITMFPDGRAIIHAGSESKAKEIYGKYTL